MKKYVFKPYSEIFPELFLREKERISSHINSTLSIEHVGSTAIPGLGGKGIIDIAIAVPKKDIPFFIPQFQSIGYEFRPSYSTPDRAYFIIYLPDPEEGTRRYHLHLTYLESADWTGLIAFRDYLRTHPKDAEEYSELKRKAALLSDQDGEKYRMLKNPMFKKILDKTT
ncbi:MAG: GrpB family protein [Chlamydiae bacterium]|nr:GrpB family protein [Chlamydiota bacterium]